MDKRETDEEPNDPNKLLRVWVCVENVFLYLHSFLLKRLKKTVQLPYDFGKTSSTYNSKAVSETWSTSPLPSAQGLDKVLATGGLVKNLKHLLRAPGEFNSPTNSNYANPVHFTKQLLWAYHMQGTVLNIWGRYSSCCPQWVQKNMCVWGVRVRVWKLCGEEDETRKKGTSSWCKSTHHPLPRAPPPQKKETKNKEGALRL